jgi:hypothetical protein
MKVKRKILRAMLPGGGNEKQRGRRVVKGMRESKIK